MIIILHDNNNNNLFKDSLYDIQIRNFQNGSIDLFEIILLLKTRHTLLRIHNKVRISWYFLTFDEKLLSGIIS